MPFGDWIAFWYETYCKPQLGIRTQVNYEERIYKHIIPEIGNIPLDKLNQNDLQQFYTRLKTSGRLKNVEQFGPGLSDRMVRVCHASCSAALKRAVEEGLIRVNPAAGCKLPPKKSGEMQILTQEEMQRFLLQAKVDGYYELFLLEKPTPRCQPRKRKSLLPEAVFSPISRNIGNPEQAVFTRSMTTSGRADTPRSVPMVSGSAGMSTPKPGRNVRKSWR